MSIGTNGTTGNRDFGNTCCVLFCRIFCSKSINRCIRSIAGVSISTYRAVCTATIDAMEHTTASDCDIGVTLDETESYIIIVTKATTIDVAVGSTTLTRGTDGTTTDRDIRVTANLRQLTTAIDTLSNRDALKACDF